MNLPTETTDQPNSFFRCPVQSDHSKAVIRVGRCKIDATVQETSIDGFTVLVSPKGASKLKVGRPWVLEYDGTRIEIHPQWLFNAPDGHAQIGLRRLRDLTQPDPIGRSWLTRFGGSRYENPNNAAVVFGGFVLFLFALMALPGFGERLGTASRIQDAFRWMISCADKTLDQWI